MKPKVTLLLAVLVLASASAGAFENRIQGVPWDAVNWEKLCKNIKPLAYRSSSGQVCPKVHPADPVWRKWHDITGRNKPEPKWRCDAIAKKYERAAKKVSRCRALFATALDERAAHPEDFDESVKVWRARYFGPWLTGN
jgi:hypothetical protein